MTRSAVALRCHYTSRDAPPTPGRPYYSHSQYRLWSLQKQPRRSAASTPATQLVLSTPPSGQAECLFVVVAAWVASDAAP